MTEMYDPDQLVRVFDPEERGMCARCDRRPPEFFEILKTRALGHPESTVKLGFCSGECHTAFVGGISAVKSLPDL